MPKYKKQITEVKLFIIHNDKKHYVEGLTDSAPTVFETINEVEARFNVEAGFESIEIFNHYIGEVITIGLEYPESSVTISATFRVEGYERRFGSAKGPIVTHVLKGSRT